MAKGFPDRCTQAAAELDAAVAALD